mmetsp:Transcript_92437/g.261686  ORF Transcript_92437/g.261686 Transcript_92437/m.261686 type:complete len:201 (-) Transcript_92437:186-788(-)
MSAVKLNVEGQLKTVRKVASRAQSTSGGPLLGSSTSTARRSCSRWDVRSAMTFGQRTHLLPLLPRSSTILDTPAGRRSLMKRCGSSPYSGGPLPTSPTVSTSQRMYTAATSALGVGRFQRCASFDTTFWVSLAMVPWISRHGDAQSACGYSTSENPSSLVRCWKADALEGSMSLTGLTSSLNSMRNWCAGFALSIFARKD